MAVTHTLLVIIHHLVRNRTTYEDQGETLRGFVALNEQSSCSLLALFAFGMKVALQGRDRSWNRDQVNAFERLAMLSEHFFGHFCQIAEDREAISYL